MWKRPDIAFLEKVIVLVHLFVQVKDHFVYISFING